MCPQKKLEPGPPSKTSSCATVHNMATLLLWETRMTEPIRLVMGRGGEGGGEGRGEGRGGELKHLLIVITNQCV